MINWNSEPYNDDFSEDKKFVKILFRPGKAVQTRELNQLQSIIQNQISRQGDHIFKQGARVVPGELALDTNVGYVLLNDSYNEKDVNTIVDTLIGKKVINQNGLVAQVKYATKRNVNEPAVLFLTYKNSGTNQQKIFASNDVLNVGDDLNFADAFDSALQTQVYSGSVRQINGELIAVTGVGSLAEIRRGVYYINGYFVLVQDQTLILDEYNNEPTYRVGLKIVEDIVTPEEDESLLDNSQGTQNFAAPGAHRYTIDLVLEKRAIASPEDKDFIELVRIEGGSRTKEVQETEYSILEETMARRTYDESGDYVVRQFKIDLREHRNNDRGLWKASNPLDVKTKYLYGDVVKSVVDGTPHYYVCKSLSGGFSSQAPTHVDETLGSVYQTYTDGIKWEYTKSPSYNRGFFLDGDSDKVSVGLEPGKAYVRGYEIQKIATERLILPKAREYAEIETAIVPVVTGSYVLVQPSGPFGLPDIRSFSRVNLYKANSISEADKIGSCRIRGIELHNSSPLQYKLFIFDVIVDSDQYYFEDTMRISTGGDFNLPGYFSCLRAETRLNLYEPQNTGLVYSLPYYAVKSILDEDRILYTTTEVIDVPVTELVPGSGNYSGYYDLTGRSRSFVPGETNHIVIASGQVVPLSNLDIDISGSGSSTDESQLYGQYYSGDPFLTQMNLSITGIPTGLTTVKLLTSVRVIGAKRKNKTLQTGTVYLSTKQEVESKIISLGQADGYRIISVMMDPNGYVTNPSYTVDISDRYEFDNGQRDTHYDIANLTLKGSYAPPAGKVRIVFEYFYHFDVGEYFNLHSYDSVLPYDKIPSYKGVALRDCFDFRSRIDSSGNFTNLSPVPKRYNEIFCNFEHYLPKKAKVCLDNTGKFSVVDGESALRPTDPEQPKLSIVLYNLDVEPYTFSPGIKSINVGVVDNKRYTMRDIGKIERRLENLEYYTTLSLLEQQTSTTPIVDNEGLDRFKNGFIVDNFSSHSVSDLLHPDNKWAVDPDSQEMRPMFSIENVNLVEDANSNVTRSQRGYGLYGDIITLPIVEHVVLIDQPYGSRTENVNPFAVFTFIGNMNINPSSDEWFETNRMDDIRNSVEGNFSSMLAQGIASGIIESGSNSRTVWNDWQTNWTGQVLNSRQFDTMQLFSNAITTNNTTDIVDASNALRNAHLDRNLFTADELRVIDAGRDVIAGIPGGDPINGLGISALSGLGQFTVDTVALTVTNTRSGATTSLRERIDQELVGDRVVSTSVIPFIRSRNILIQTKGLKADTQFFPFFDDVSILSYCTPATIIKYTSINSIEFDASTNAGSDSKEVARQIDGDPQMCLNIGDVITQTVGSNTSTAVVVGKHKDSINNTYIRVLNIKGSFSVGSSITGSISGATGTVQAVTPHTIFKSSVNGELEVLFNIPQTNSVRFRSGHRQFKLLDSENAVGFTSRAVGTYYAQGVLEDRQFTFNSVRNGQFVRVDEFDSTTNTGVIDRLADAVYVNPAVYVDPLAQTFLVESRGGAFLTKVDIFFAQKDANVPVTLEIREVINGVPGKVVVPFSRVTLNPDKVNISSNTVVVDGTYTPKSDTPTTFTFSSPVYLNDNQEYCLVLLSDSNNYRVWISQMGDTIPDSNRTISEQPSMGVLFKSQNASTWTADQTQDLMFKIYRAKFDTSRVGEVIFGNDIVPQHRLGRDSLEFRKGSSYMRVYQMNHGLKAGDNVVLSGASGTTISGISVSNINATHTVHSVQLDSYMVYLGDAVIATTSGYFGGDNMKAIRNYTFNAVQPIVQSMILPGTNIAHGLRTSKYSNGGMDIDYVAVVANDNNILYDNTKIVKSGTTPSCYLKCLLASTNDAISPVIDTHRTSLILVANNINAPTQNNYITPGFDYKLWESGKVYVAGELLYVPDTAGVLTAGKLYKVVVVPSTTQTPPHADYSLVETVGDYLPFYSDDTVSSGSSTYSNYISRRIKLLNPSSLIKIYFAANVPRLSDLEVYYRVTETGTGQNIASKSWNKIDPESPIVKVENGKNTFTDLSFMEEVVNATTGTVATFDSVQIKIVMKSSSPVAVPKVKDLRIIACAPV